MEVSQDIGTDHHSDRLNFVRFNFKYLYMKTFILILFFAAFCFLCFKIFSKKKKKKSGGKPSVNSPRVRPNENDVPNIDFDRDDNLGDRFLKK